MTTPRPLINFGSCALALEHHANGGTMTHPGLSEVEPEEVLRKMKVRGAPPAHVEGEPIDNPEVTRVPLDTAASTVIGARVRRRKGAAEAPDTPPQAPVETIATPPDVKPENTAPEPASEAPPAPSQEAKPTPPAATAPLVKRRHAGGWPVGRPRNWKPGDPHWKTGEPTSPNTAPPRRQNMIDAVRVQALDAIKAIAETDPIHAMKLLKQRHQLLVSEQEATIKALHEVGQMAAKEAEELLQYAKKAKL